MSGASATVTAELHYRDPEAALAWLAEAFGFQTRMTLTDADGRLTFAQAGWGEASVNICAEAAPERRSPQSAGGANTQMLQIRGDFDLDAHCARARAAGARIVQEPELFFFGDKVYVASDPEGHLWSFGQRMPGAGGPPPEGWTVRFPARERSGD